MAAVGILRSSLDLAFPAKLRDSETLLEGFERASAWNVLSGSALDNLLQYQMGMQSIKVISTLGGSSIIEKVVNLDLSAGDGFSLSIYCHDDPNLTQSALFLTLYNDSNNYFGFSQLGKIYVGQGWNEKVILKSAMYTFGSPSWNLPISKIRLELDAALGQTPQVSYDKFVGISLKAGLLLTFDDGNLGVFRNAFPITSAHHMPVTSYIPTSFVGQAGRCTWEQLQYLSNANWAIASHTALHVHLTALTEMQQEAELLSAKQALESHGLTRASAHLAYPFGEYNNDTFTAMTNLGILTGRMDSRPRELYLPPQNNRELFTRFVDVTTPLAAVKSYIDQAIANKSMMILFLHDVGDAPNQWSTSNFRNLTAYIIQNRGKIVPMDIDHFYRLESGPVTIPLTN